MSAWTRAHAATLARASMQAALSPEEALEALMIGARIKAHGFSGQDLDEMIQRQHQELADIERAIDNLAASPMQMRKLRRGTLK